MLMKQKTILIVVMSFLINGCSNTSPTVVRNGGTETTQVNGATIASMRHQDCYDKGNYLVCSDANGNQATFKTETLFGQGLVGNSSNGNIKHTKIESTAENASGVVVKTYPFFKTIYSSFKGRK